MSNIKLYKKLNRQYDKIHKVSYLLNKKDLTCVKELENWLSTTEIILKDNYIHEKDIIEQLKKQLEIECTRIDKIKTKKNRELNAVSELMKPTKQTVIDILEPMSQKINQSEVLIKRMLATKNFNYNKGLDYRDYILAVWRTLLYDNSTSALASKVLDLVDEDDALELVSKNLKSKNH